ncbi:sulfate adenylyltransferase subunit CysN [Ponticaulis sp.]|uniref:sulfate adenylyltransferase subunit CysN n=1 Tax=Ponticaulis sp. TaxID=2020902 RepID=UPI0026109251|nr:sulfate adenylyltransferase subunit CysN [Ponticaulis sp.]MDF1681294.1 sulfate adenylyltransferase subunit CysN [Ponticaulis sp.]
MSDQNSLLETDIRGYLEAHENKSLLRFITCGSVDDGKSTLIGRMLYDSKMIFEDQLDALESDSKRVGTQGENIDFALLVDGLTAEREQGITIDVAYRFFSTDKRKFIVADTPGHVQYTRNMATGASTADLAILLIDARRGVLEQTRRHAFIASSLGIRKLVLAINKMDLQNYEQSVFDDIESDFIEFAEELATGIEIQAIPMSALEGTNITTKSDQTPWYDGPSLMEYLETVPVDDDRLNAPFRLPVQYVNRPNLDFRGFSGQIPSGSVKVGDRVKTLPSAKETTVTRILSGDQDVQEATAGESVTVCFADEVDTSRGDLICTAESPAQVADQFQARIFWMADDKMLPGRRYLMKIGSKTVTAQVNETKYRIEMSDLQDRPARDLSLNEVGVCTLSLDQAIPFDPYNEIRETGGFILIDRLNNNTVGMGMIDFALRRAGNIHWQSVDVNKEAHSAQKNQKPAVLWFTGLSGSGKSTIANALQKRLYSIDRHTYLLDGDNVRHGLNRDLGFTDADRVENIRRVSEVSKLMVDAGLITLVSFISPFRSERRMARNMVEDGEFVEVFVNTPLNVAEERDVKGLYKRAREGKIKNFTGIDSPYEPPTEPEIEIDTTKVSADEAAEIIVDWMKERGMLG